MNLQFITSISANYWESVGKYCIKTWDLPGEIIIYIDQKEGNLDWLDQVPHKKRLLYVPSLTVSEHINNRTKVKKFWGKSCAQIHAIRNRPLDTRIIWLDADVEQVSSVKPEIFEFYFDQAVAMMKSNDYSEDCYESGLVIFNESYKKLSLFATHYEKFWKTEEKLLSLFRPYDAMVLGELAQEKGFLNLVHTPCDNKDALENTRFSEYFKHWINKDNKKVLREKSDE